MAHSAKQKLCFGYEYSILPWVVKQYVWHQIGAIFKKVFEKKFVLKKSELLGISPKP